MDYQVTNRDQANWWLTLRRYFTVTMAGNLAWELVQLPLYTLWQTGSMREKMIAILHCTAGDLLIAAASLLGALLIAGNPRWPITGFGRVMILAIGTGFGYTVFSEWLNTSVRGTWAYADAMPLLLGVGVSPLLQWIAVPALSFWFAHRRIGHD